MKYIIVILSLCYGASSQTKVSTKTSSEPFNLEVMLAAMFSITTNVQDYNSSIVNPNLTCDKNWQPADPVPVGASEPSVDVDGRPKGADLKSEFSMDANPNTESVLKQGCISEALDILEKCFPPMADKLRTGQITMDQLRSSQSEGFHIRSYSKDLHKARSWEFHYENRARQDTGLSIMDGYLGRNKKIYGAEMMFFPRKQIPKYETKGSELVVTLSNGEKVNFDSQSGAIKSGVLTENKPVPGRKPNIKYQGDGVMIQMIGIEGNMKSYSETATNAIVYKKGFPPCTVPASDLWPKRKSNQANNFKFATDEGLAQWLNNSKCGFSL